MSKANLLDEFKPKALFKDQGNIVSEELYKIITMANGSPDFLAINIYTEVRSWFKPKSRKEGDNVISISKLSGRGWKTCYSYFASKFKCSKEQIRKKLVKLEELGLIKRDLRTEYYAGRPYNNILYILLWKVTPHFYSEVGLDKTEEEAKEVKTKVVKEKKPKEKKVKKICDKPLETPPQNGGGMPNECRGSIQQALETNIDTNNLPTNQTKEDIIPSNTQDARATPEVASSFFNSFQGVGEIASLPQARSLDEWIDDITEDNLATINKEAGREDFTNNPPFEMHFVEKLMRKLSKPERKFHAKQAVIKYLAKALEHEKVSHHQANNPDFHIMTPEERIIDEYWRKRDEEHHMLKANTPRSGGNGFMNILENLEVVSDEELARLEEERKRGRKEHPQRELIDFVFHNFGAMRSTAIWSHVVVDDDEQNNKVILKIKQNFILSDEEKELLKTGVKLAYGEDVTITAKVIAVDKRVTSNKYCESDKTPTWNAMRKDLIYVLGDAIVRSWFDKSRIEENNKTKEVILHTTPLCADYIYSDYMSKVDELVEKYGYTIRVTYVDKFDNQQKDRVYYGGKL